MRRQRRHKLISIGKETGNRSNDNRNGPHKTRVITPDGKGDYMRGPNVRLIGEDGEQLGIKTIQEAKLLAKEAGLDLVEISPNADPPVVRVMDYKKFLFQESKQRTLAKKKQKKVEQKEVKFRPSTAKADYEVKLRNLRGFLENGDKVKVTVFFRGREITHPELGMTLLERIKDELAEESKVEFFPKLEGRQLVMILSPKKKA